MWLWTLLSAPRRQRPWHGACTAPRLFYARNVLRKHLHGHKLACCIVAACTLQQCPTRAHVCSQLSGLPECFFSSSSYDRDPTPPIPQTATTKNHHKHHKQEHTCYCQHRLLRETFEPELLTPGTRFHVGGTTTVIEVGPRSNFSTAFSTNAVSIAASCGLSKVSRLERSRRFAITSTRPLTGEIAVDSFDIWWWECSTYRMHVCMGATAHSHSTAKCCGALSTVIVGL